MTGLAVTAERFAAGDLVLVGDERDETIFVAAAAVTVAPERLERLHELGRGMVVLGLADAIAQRLELRQSSAAMHRRLDLNLTTPIDAAAGIRGGWSMHDQALTMRVAADPHTGPRDLTIPGHVHPARIDEQRMDAAAAAIELARLSGCTPAVALGAVVGRDGQPASLRDARRDRELGRLPVAATAELHGWSISRRADELAVSAELPTREGLFRAVGYAPTESAPPTVALIHGDPAALSRPLVHVHVACLFGDAFGSLLCDCRRELDGAIAAMVSEGAGVIIYAKPEQPALVSCAREERIDAALAAGLLRTAGVRRLRLSTRSGWLSGELRARGLEPV